MENLVNSKAMRCFELLVLKNSNELGPKGNETGTVIVVADR